MAATSFDIKGFLNDPKVQADKPAAIQYLQQKGIIDASGKLISGTTKGTTDFWGSVGKGALNVGGAVLGGVKDVAAGVSKGAIQHAVSLGAGIESGLDAVANAIPGVHANTSATPTAFANQPGFQAKNLGETIGKGGETVAEFIAPEAGGAGVARGLAGDAVRGVPYVGRALSVGARALTTGLTGGAVVAGQTGSLKQGAEAVPVFSAFDVGGQAIGAVLPTVRNVASRIIGAGTNIPNISNKLNAYIVDQFGTAMRKSVGASKDTAGALQRGKTDIANGVRAIVENKGILKDEAGNPMGLPENAQQQVDAITQVMQNIYQKYDALASSATGRGSKFDAAPILDAMETYMADASKTDTQVAHMQGLMDEITRLDGQSYSTVANRVKTYNKSLGPMMTSGKETQASDAVGFLTNKIVGQMDDQISRTEGAGYAELRKQLGYVKGLEKTAVRAVGKAARGGMSEQLYNVWSMSEILRGAITQSPSKIFEGAGVLAAKAGIKTFASTDKLIYDMYRTVDATYARAIEKGLDLTSKIPENGAPPVAGLLPQGPTITPPPADTSGPVPQVPGVNVPAPQVPQRTALPPGTPGYQGPTKYLPKKNSSGIDYYGPP